MAGEAIYNKPKCRRRRKPNKTKIQDSPPSSHLSSDTFSESDEGKMQVIPPIITNSTSR
jgi:hypothetical protein